MTVREMGAPLVGGADEFAYGSKEAMGGASEPALAVRSLVKRFGSFEAVRDVTFSVPRGRVFGFLGPNGAGKTTTIGMLLGLVRPTEGRVEVLGRRVAPGRTAALRGVGALIGAPALVPGLSAYSNLALAARLGGVTDRSRLMAVLERVGLVDVAHRRAGTFSTGMKQRLGLAIALVEAPELLVLDEPTSGMDAAARREVRNLLTELKADGVTVFLSSHLLHEVEQVCDEVAVLNRGRLVASGPVASLRGGRSVVRVRVEDVAAAGASLRTLSGLRRVERNGGFLEVEGVDSRMLVEHLVRAGHTPSEVRSLGSDLEALFLELTESAEAGVAA